MNSKLADISFKITGFHFGEIERILNYLKISDNEWSISEAKVEFDHIVLSELSKYKSSSNPKMTVVSGIPFSGKSTYINIEIKKMENSLLISFDSIMKRISLYEKIMSYDPKLAFSKCELIARIIGYEILRKSIEYRYNVVFEHSSTPFEHLELYRSISEECDYMFCFIYIDCSVALARQRALSQQGVRDGGRYTPLEYIDERYKVLKEMLVEYRKYFDVKEVKQNEFN